MKETYYTPETIQRKSKEMVQDSYSGIRPRTWELRRPALLVLDMQAYFLEAGSHAFVPSSSALIAGIQALIAAFAARALPVIFTRHENTPANAGQMAVWWRELLQPDHPLGGILPALQPEMHSLIVKSQYDAFYDTPLEDNLRAQGVTQVFICGLMAHLCCETTARSAFVRGFEVFYLADGTAAYTERHHRAALLSLAHGFAVLTRVEEVLVAVEKLDVYG